MSKQRSKRQRAIRRDLWSPNSKSPPPFKDPAYFYRRVEEPSVEAIERSTRGISGREATRIVGSFALTLAYPARLQRAIERSPLTEPLLINELASKLGGVVVGSLIEPVVAEVIDVKQYGGGVGISVDYPGYEEEQRQINTLARELLGFPKSHGISVGPGKPHISIVQGQLDQTQVDRIKDSLPPTVNLSSVNRV